jgi:ribosomal-protein-alanine N-acetyltransferase
MLSTLLRSLPQTRNHVTIGPLTLEEHLLIQGELIQEPVARYTCRPVKARTAEEVEADFVRSSGERSVVRIGFRESPDAELAGRILLFDYNPRNRSAEIGYFTRPDFRRRGLTKDALELLIELAFTVADLNKVYAQTVETNRASIRLLESLGFHRDGVLREHHEIEGRLVADFVYSRLAGDTAHGRGDA